MLPVTLHDKVKNPVIRGKNHSQRHLRKILEKIDAKWKWAGHVARRMDNKWTKWLKECQPRTRKRRKTEQEMRQQHHLH